MRWITPALLWMLFALPVAAQNDEDAPNPIPDEICTANTGVSAYFEDGRYDVFRFGDQDRINLTDDAANDYLAALSPDMEQVAFISDHNSDVVELYLMTPEGENIRQLTVDGLPKGFFNWSLDSRHIAYAAFYNTGADWQELFTSMEGFAGQPADIFVIDVETRDVRQLTNGLATITTVSWNTEMTQIAFAGEQDGINGIYTVPAAGGDIQLIAELDEGAFPTVIQWSPDSRSIAYMVSAENSYGLFVAEVEMGVVTDLSGENPDDFSLFTTWTADSSGIIQLNFADGQQYEMINIETGEVTPIWEVTAQAVCLENVRAANALLAGEISTP